jgi:cyclic pyranopterin phosphate synthase
VAVRFPRIPLLGSRSVPELFAGKLTAVLLTATNRRFRKMTNFSHLDEEGAARMVDVGGKAMIQRTATATGRISMSRETVELLREKALPKGDALNTARIAGVMAAKRTPDLIPLCHGLNLTSVDLDFSVSDDGVEILGVARANDRTGVEMEALIAVSVAALTLYDMCKAVDKGMEIGDIKLLEKTKEELSW